MTPCSCCQRTKYIIETKKEKKIHVTITVTLEAQQIIHLIDPENFIALRGGMAALIIRKEN